MCNDCFAQLRRERANLILQNRGARVEVDMNFNGRIPATLPLDFARFKKLSTVVLDGLVRHSRNPFLFHFLGDLCHRTIVTYGLGLMPWLSSKCGVQSSIWVAQNVRDRRAFRTASTRSSTRLLNPVVVL